MQALWRTHSDDQTLDQQFHATITGLIGIEPRNEVDRLAAAASDVLFADLYRHDTRDAPLRRRERAALGSVRQHWRPELNSRHDFARLWYFFMNNIITGHQDTVILENLNTHKRMVAEWQPDVIAFSCNYLANVPEIIDLAKATKLSLRHTFICVGGHSASLTARALLEHRAGAIDCVLQRERATAIVKLLEAIEGDRGAISKVPGAVTAEDDGPPPAFVQHLDDVRPARDLVRNRRKYFIGVLDPCAS